MFKKSIKCSIAYILAMIMIFTLLPGTALAANEASTGAETDAVFEVGGVTFTNLNSAIEYAVDSNISKITLVSSGSLPAGDYTIPNGVTLLIPMDDEGTTVSSGIVSSSETTASSVFRKLTMEDGASITVNGSLQVAATIYSASGGQNQGGRPVGGYGLIEMNNGSSILLNNGSSLYCYGFITGEGTVTAKSGAEVHEVFQITEFRGGSNMLAISCGSVFPLSQYYVQNIEVPVTFENGSIELLHSTLYANGEIQSVNNIPFIGSQNGLFKMVSGSTVIKSYKPNEDRLQFDIYGDTSVEEISLNLAGANFSSSSYVLPINSNININIHSGTTTIANNTELLPGVRVTIAEGANLSIANEKTLFVYDSTDWMKATNGNGGGYVFENLDMIAVYYRPGGVASRSLSDAVIDINGSITVNGYLNTTANGASIKSSEETGLVIIKNKQTAQTLNQIINGRDSKNITTTAAMLQNADGSYTQTVGATAGTTYYYCALHDKWETERHVASTNTITFNANEGSGEMEAQTVNSGEDATLTANAFTCEHYSFTGWNTEADGSGTAYADGAIINITEDITLYAQWKIDAFSVLWMDEEGNVLELDENVPYGTMPTYDGETPTKEGDAQYTYTFAGWDPEVEMVTGDVVYIAKFTPSKNQYSITFLPNEGTGTMDPQTAESGETVTLQSNIFTREGYKFTGWNTQADGGGAGFEDGETFTLAENLTLYAQWQLDQYEITWSIEGEDTVTTYSSGAIPVYDGTPVKESDAQYDYEFDRWDPEPVAVTGNATYTAVFKSIPKQYKITWVVDGVETVQSYEYGAMPDFGETPSKQATEQFSYTFVRWSPEPVSVTEDATYTAEFSENLNRYDVIFKDWDGRVLQNDPFSYGEKPVYSGELPTREADEDYTYEFAGWDPEINENTVVTGDMEFTAKYSATDIYKPFTGWKEDENGKQYIIEDEVQHGWITLENGTYYLDAETGYAVVNGVYWLPYAEGYAPDAWDLANNDNYAALGGEQNSYFVFDIEGVFRSGLNGMQTLAAGTKIDGRDSEYALEDDLTVWAVNGELPWHPGLVTDGTNYYYFPTNYFEDGNVSTLIKGADYYISKTNDLDYPTDGKFEKGKYTFDDNGVLQLYDGLTDIGDTTYYYVKGVKTYAGLVKIGDDLYYVNSSGIVIKDRSYYVSKTNGLVEAGTYTFDADGKMVNLNGIVKDGDTWYYYVNGVKTYAGLIMIDGDYYYVKTDKTVVHDSEYYITKTNDLKPQGSYTFDADGKMIVLDGIVKDGDVWYYYVDGAKTYAGLIEIDGAYYYVKSDKTVVHGKSYYVSKTNGLVSAGTYTFDADGAMIVA